jgi:uncharacterized protein
MARRGLTSDTLSAIEARRIALSAQGFRGQLRERKATWAKIAPVAEDLQLLQIDSVNVLVRSHYLPLFARLGNYDMSALDKRTFDNRHRHFFECWAHEASLVPLTLHPLMRWRMTRAQNGNGTYRHMNQFGRDEKTYLGTILSFIQSNGPVRASDIPEGGKSAGGWWGWSKGKLALETLFDQGLLTTATRQGFERIYDVPERVIPSAIHDLPTPSEAGALQELIKRSATALGIGTEKDLIDYFRLPAPEARLAIAACLEAGQLKAVDVEGWSKKAYLSASAELPRKAGGRALLTPFDPLVWNRDRAERMFNFHYRIELYTPQHKRKFGYYVLPFLHGEKLAGRVCLKADRATSTLLVNTSHVEAGCNADETGESLAAELQLMAQWLGLDHIKAAKKGNLASTLKRYLA